MSPTASGASLFTSSSVSTKESSAASTKTSDSTSLTASDFLKLFVTQVKNQDFNDPMDNSDMMNQITQLSNMQMMQEMASYSKSGFALSLVGKTVTATRFDTSGNVDTTTGTISKVALVDDEYVFYVNGKKYTLDQIKEIQSGSGKSSSMDVSSYTLSTSSVTNDSATIKWSVPTEDTTLASGLKYTVYYSQKGPFSTVSEVESGTRFGAADQKELTGATITGLASSQAYYVNVLVKDAEGNKYVYSPRLLVTNK